MLAICIAARKGGQSRSTTCFNLAGAFAAAGRRVLCLDSDPQPTLSRLWIGPEAVEGLAADQTLAAVYGGRAAAASVVHPTAWDGISVIPSGDHLQAFDQLRAEDHPGLCLSLRSFLPQLAGLADVLLMDTAPNAGLLTFSALIAASGVLTPVIPEANAVWELDFLQRFIGQVQARFNPALCWLGLFAAACSKRLAIHRTYVSQLSESFGERWLPVAIPESAQVKEAAALRRPLPLWKPRTAAARAFVELAAALWARAGLGTTKEVA